MLLLGWAGWEEEEEEGESCPCLEKCSNSLGFPKLLPAWSYCSSLGALGFFQQDLSCHRSLNCRTSAGLWGVGRVCPGLPGCNLTLKALLSRAPDPSSRACGVCGATGHCRVCSHPSGGPEPGLASPGSRDVSACMELVLWKTENPQESFQRWAGTWLRWGHGRLRFVVLDTPPSLLNAGSRQGQGTSTAENMWRHLGWLWDHWELHGASSSHQMC